MTAEPLLEVIPAPPPEGPPAAGLLAGNPMPSALASDDARAEAGSWAPSTRRSYVAGWRDFTQWCLDTGVRGLPAAPADVGRYLEHLMEARGRALATARSRLAAVSAAHRLAGHPDPASRPLVKATLKRLGREHGKPRKQARGLTAEALAAVRATARTQRVHQGRRRSKETGPQAARRALMDLALLQVMRDGLLRRSEAAALRWGDVEFHADGSGRLTIARSKTDQAAGGATLYLGPAAVEALLAIRPEAAVTDPAGSVFGLSANQISRRIKAAGRMAGLGDGFSAHSPRVGMAQDLSAAGAELPELMTAGRWDSPTMPARYTEAQAAGRGAVAQYYRGGLRGSRTT